MPHSIEDTLHPSYLPLRVKGVLLPFKGQIIYDGLSAPYNISLGGGIRASLREEYLAAKQNNRFLTATAEGKMHDKKLADQAGYTLPPGSQLAQDTGFQGFTLDNGVILQPKKKPKGDSLTDWQKLTNHALSSLRIRIEHAIGGVQRHRIVKDKIRNWKAGFRDAVMATACAIHNFRLTFRPWHYGPLQLPLFLDLNSI